MKNDLEISAGYNSMTNFIENGTFVYVSYNSYVHGNTIDGDNVFCETHFLTVSRMAYN